jgi:hypothetical protein
MPDYTRRARMIIQADLEEDLRLRGFGSTRKEKKWKERGGRILRENHALLGFRPDFLYGGSIDVGPGAINRMASLAATITQVDKANPANDTGIIDEVKLYFATNGSNVEVASFAASGNNLTTNDSEALGSVTAGSEQTFSSLDMDITSGEYIGLYGTAGACDSWVSGGAGVWSVTGDYIPCSSQAFTLNANWVISIYGTGETGTDHEKSLSDSVAISDSPSKAIGVGKSDSVALAEGIGQGIGVGKSDSVAVADIFAKQSDFARALADSVAVADVISKGVGLPFAESIAIAESMVKAIGKGLSETITLADNFDRVIVFVRAYSDSVTIADAISKAIGLPFSDSLAVVDLISKQPGIILSDSVPLADAIAQATGVTFADSVAIADICEKLPVHVSSRESVSARELPSTRRQATARDKKGWV